MRYQKIRQYDVANGYGLRVSIWLTGCSVKCKHCFNKELWNPNTGHEFTEKTKEFIFKLLESPHIKGLSILGGEPTDHDEELSLLLQELKTSYPDKDVWMWSGYTLKQLIDKGRTKCFPYIDYLIDGPFVNSLSDKNLLFRGSSNQIIYKKQDNIWIAYSYT